jgi:hypothetical protein
MSPFRPYVLITGFVLAIPVLALGLRGDLTADEVVTRVLWCLGAGWAAVSVLHMATRPSPPPGRPAPGTPPPAAADGEPAAEDPVPMS